MGRFAPTPSGDLHLGSLVAAVASAVDAKHHAGMHRLRIDDIDPPRTVDGSCNRIIDALKRYAVPMDGDVVMQSESLPLFKTALTELASNNYLFACTCSRKLLDGGIACVSQCRTHRISNATPIDQQLRTLNGVAAIRLDPATQGNPSSLTVRDGIQPTLNIADVATLGTPVLWRKDGLVSYLLATAVNDSDGITDVVRGADLWSETATQQWVMELLGRPVPNWVHIPCATDDAGAKLGKQTQAASIHDEDPITQLQKAWRFLGQSPLSCGSLDEFWAKAPAAWDLARIPRVQAQRIE